MYCGCMYGCTMGVWMYGCLDVWMLGCMDEYMDVWMHVCMYGCMYVRMYVYANRYELNVIKYVETILCD